jgi:IS30 family transposase
MRISHEAIYKSLYVQSRGGLRRDLTACLRTGRALRVPRARSRGRGKAFIGPEVLISERPADAADRAVPGHWEGDLILGLGSSPPLNQPSVRAASFLIGPETKAAPHAGNWSICDCP